MDLLGPSSPRGTSEATLEWRRLWAKTRCVSWAGTPFRPDVHPSSRYGTKFCDSHTEFCDSHTVNSVSCPLLMYRGYTKRPFVRNVNRRTPATLVTSVCYSSPVGELRGPRSPDFRHRDPVSVPRTSVTGETHDDGPGKGRRGPGTTGVRRNRTPG